MNWNGRCEQKYSIGKAKRRPLRLCMRGGRKVCLVTKRWVARKWFQVSPGSGDVVEATLEMRRVGGGGFKKKTVGVEIAQSNAPDHWDCRTDRKNAEEMRLNRRGGTTPY